MTWRDACFFRYDQPPGEHKGCRELLMGSTWEPRYCVRGNRMRAMCVVHQLDELTLNIEDSSFEPGMTRSENKQVNNTAEVVLDFPPMLKVGVF